MKKFGASVGFNPKTMARLTRAEQELLTTYGNHPNYRVELDHRNKLVAIPLCDAIDPNKSVCLFDNEKFITGTRFLCNQAKVYQYDKADKMLYQIGFNGVKSQLGMVTEITTKSFLIDVPLLSQLRQLQIKFIDLIFF